MSGDEIASPPGVAVELGAPSLLLPRADSHGLLWGMGSASLCVLFCGRSGQRPDGIFLRFLVFIAEVVSLVYLPAGLSSGRGSLWHRMSVCPRDRPESVSSVVGGLNTFCASLCPKHSRWRYVTEQNGGRQDS